MPADQSPTRLLILRHAQTASNALGTFVDDRDELTELGQRQAAQLAERLAGEPLDVAYYSGSARTVQTLAPIAQRHPGMQLRLEPELREGRVGDWQAALVGRRWEEALRLGVPVWQVQPPGGESWQDISDRVEPLLETIRRQHPGESVLMVGQGRINSLAIRLLEAEPWQRYAGRQQPHASLSVLRLMADSARLLLREDNCFIDEDLRTI